jgi:hypothetical protein
VDEVTPGHTVENLAYPTVATWKSASRPGDPPPQTGAAGEAGEINCTLLALISDRASKFAPTAPDSTALPHNRLSDSA